MQKQTLEAEVREGRGKGPVRQLRQKGLMPAVIYGKGVDPTPIAISPKELTKALSTPFGRNVAISLKMQDGEKLTLLKELQLDPLGKELLHADFYRIEPDSVVRVAVPFRTKGRAAGVVKGGELHVVYRKVPVLCTIDKIPAVIEVDVSALEMHETIAVKDVKLPEGVSIDDAPAKTLVAVETERRKAAAEQDEAAEGAAAAGGDAGEAKAS